jgi:hypothetical protein
MEFRVFLKKNVSDKETGQASELFSSILKNVGPKN